MRYWFDTEFIEDGKTIDLISIGIVSEDGREYYAECAECDLNAASDWVKANVIPHLTANITPRAQIAKEIVEFVGPVAYGDARLIPGNHGPPEFWAYYADYDWVALCQLFGRMIDLPKGWPMYCRDVKQLCDELGNPILPTQGKGGHHALADARWARSAWQYLQNLDGN